MKKKQMPFTNQNECKCLRGFPYQEWLNDFQEYPQSQIYYRRSFEDRYVVSYNPELLKLMKTHTNVQIVAQKI